MSSERPRDSSPPTSLRGDTQPAGTELGRALLALPAAPANVLVEASKIAAVVGQSYLLVDDRLGIGREPCDDNRLVLAGDAQVSSRHAEIVRRTDGWYCVDRRSTNGTYINGGRIQARRLLDGDRVQIGSTRLVFHEGVRSVPQPYPLAVARKLWRAQSNAHARHKAITDAIELALKFLVAAQLGAIAQARPDELAPALRNVTRGSLPSKLSMGHWIPLAHHLGKVALQLDIPSVRTASATMVDASGSATALAKEIGGAVSARNEAAHEVVVIDEVVSRDEDRLVALLDRFLDALSVFASATLVTRERLVRLDDEGRCVMEVRVHHGAEELFPVETVVLPRDLLPGWCYLLGHAGTAPILLAPLFGAGVPSGARTLELAMARGISPPRAGARCELATITSGETLELVTPDKPLETLRAALAALGERSP